MINVRLFESIVDNRNDFVTYQGEIAFGIFLSVKQHISTRAGGSKLGGLLIVGNF